MFDPETLKSILGAMVENAKDADEEPQWVLELREEIFAYAENQDDPDSLARGVYSTMKDEYRTVLAEAPLETIFRHLADAEKP